MARPRLHPIASPKTWSLLVAPARIEIVEAMRMLAPCAIAEIAAVLDRPADTLYRHVEKLVDAGLVVTAGVRRSGRRFEQVYDLVADDFTFGFKDGSGRAANRAFEECAQSFLKSTGRAVRDSAAAGQLVASDDERNLVINYELGWLTPEGFTELRALMLRAKAIMDEGKRRREGRLFLALMIATPVTRKRGARRTADATPADDGRGGRAGTRSGRTASARARGGAARGATANGGPARKPAGRSTSTGNASPKKPTARKAKVRSPRAPR